MSTLTRFVASVRRWFEPEIRREAVLAAVLLTLIMPPAVPTTAARPLAGAGRVTVRDAFDGTGIWVDWTEINGADPAITPDDLSVAATAGTTTLYVQVAKQSGGDPLYQRDRVSRLIDRAHSLSMRVIAWNLPNLDGGTHDVEVLRAVRGLDVDGYALDIESRRGTAAVRNAQLEQLAAAARSVLGRDFPLGAVVLPPVLLERVNPKWWGGPYPYATAAQRFDAILVMSYVTDRRAPWDDGYRHAVTDIAYLRDTVGARAVHVIAGYGTRFTTLDAAKAARAAREWCARGVSLYAGADVTVEQLAAVRTEFTDSDLPCRPDDCPDAGTAVAGSAFRPNGYALLPAADPALAALLRRVSATTGPVVLHGHTDSSGEAERNENLSTQRATAVREWLITRGAVASRLRVKGWGERCPIRYNGDAGGRAGNRRVEAEFVR